MGPRLDLDIFVTRIISCSCRESKYYSSCRTRSLLPIPTELSHRIICDLMPRSFFHLVCREYSAYAKTRAVLFLLNCYHSDMNVMSTCKSFWYQFLSGQGGTFWRRKYYVTPAGNGTRFFGWRQSAERKKSFCSLSFRNYTARSLRMKDSLCFVHFVSRYLRANQMENWIKLQFSKRVFFFISE